MDMIDVKRAAERAIAEYQTNPAPDHEAWRRVNTAQNAVGAALNSPIDRATYEAQCARLGIAPWTEQAIWAAGYVLRYFDKPADPLPWLDHGLARQRLEGIQAERDGRRATSPPPRLATCRACGQQVEAAALMNASTRSGVCPDCYDEYS